MVWRSIQLTFVLLFHVTNGYTLKQKRPFDAEEELGDSFNPFKSCSVAGLLVT